MVMILADVVVPLFVPGNRPERFGKAAESGADAVIIDLEDAVASNAKKAARDAIRADFTDLPVLVRINGQGTPWHDDDVAAVTKLPIAAIVLPKAELGSALETLAAKCSMPIVPLIETARGLADIRQIAALPGVTRLIFGSLDFCADVGCMHTREALLTARAELVLASRLGGLAAPVDGITTLIDDEALIASDARHALELGFGGKLAVHPRQIDPVRTGFRPDQSEIEWAHVILAGGDGAVAVAGAMVDEPVRVRARALLARASSISPSTRDKLSTRR
jgi:citrate lyase subunit beta/citryl-CoA lyase